MTGPHTTDHPDRLGEVISNLRQLESGNTLARLHARQHLVELGETTVPPLVEALRSGDRHLRWEAAKVLADIAAPASAPALVASLEDEDSGIRWICAGALKTLRSEALAPLLEGLIARAGSPELRTGAERVLRNLCDGELKSIITPVLSAIRGPVPDVTTPVVASNALSIWRRESVGQKSEVVATETP